MFITENGLFKSESPNKQKLELRSLPVKTELWFLYSEGNAPELGKTLLHPGCPARFAVRALFSLWVVVDLGK